MFFGAGENDWGLNDTKLLLCILPVIGCLSREPNYSKQAISFSAVRGNRTTFKGNSSYWGHSCLKCFTFIFQGVYRGRPLEYCVTTDLD